MDEVNQRARLAERAVLDNAILAGEAITKWGTRVGAAQQLYEQSKEFGKVLNKKKGGTKWLRGAASVAAGTYAANRRKNNISNNKMSSRGMYYGKSVGPHRPRAMRTKKVKFSKTKKLSKQVKEIKKSLKSDQGRQTIRQRDILQAGANTNQVVFTGGGSVRTTDLEAVMSSLRYYNPAVPGTLTTADASTGTYTRQVHFESITTACKVRNNYQIPCNVKLYLCTPKQDTNITPESFYSSAVTDQTIGPLAVTSPMLWMSDMDLVRNNWNLKLMKSKLLQPGQELSASKSFPCFDYDPSNTDTHSLAFQKKYRASRWIIWLQGPLGHDISAAQVSDLRCQVDAEFIRKFVITYDAGVNVNDYRVIDNASSSFTNNGGLGVVANKPVSDNQSYSVA